LHLLKAGQANVHCESEKRANEQLFEALPETNKTSAAYHNPRRLSRKAKRAKAGCGFEFTMP
jgi:hypothetical protein